MTTNPTGPPYPPLPGFGSNAIGNFKVGSSPIGDIPDFNIWDTILSQYANSPVLTQLIENMDTYLDQTYNLSQWFDNILNIATASGYGLDVWGRIVGVNRNLEVQTSQFFGFKQGLPGSLTFNEGAFYNGYNTSEIFPLPDLTYRRLIMAKAAFNITDGGIKSINTLLRNLFPNRGNAYVTDGLPPSGFFGFKQGLPGSLTFNQGPFYNGQSSGGMVITYTFNFVLTPVELAIVKNSGVIPRPSGVASSIVINA